tara:strand:+ start:687 stop:1682 length:996 start_codon:yes stop_codon:yes gene_type:complete
MRQAGRYLPEYRALRKEAGSFMNLCSNPELACEVTMQPLRRFNLDAAILFSDILTIPDAMGLGLYFEEGEGPKFKSPIGSSRDIKNLIVPDVYEKLDYVFSAVKLIKQELHAALPLIGFSGSPWTVATYMVEGSSSKEFLKIKALKNEDPNALMTLLNKIAILTIDYLNAQIESGAQALMIFDTWGGILEADDYRKFSLSFMQQIIDGLHLKQMDFEVPVILFTKGAGLKISDMADTDCDALGIDWTMTLSQARNLTNNKLALQGNLNPHILTKSEAEIEQAVADVLADYGSSPGHVFNLGHGITPDIDPAKVKLLVNTVHELSKQYHKSY